jgi:4-hydroxythreonine-4-phosphate dehydrogenase
VKPAPLRIGITLGDVNGIGPEVAVKAVARPGWPARARFVLVGSEEAAVATCTALGFSPPPPWRPDARRSPAPPRISVWEPEGTGRIPLRPGRIVPDASRAAALWVREAALACMAGRLDAVVTAPICKEGFHEAGILFPGHTELLAQVTGARRFAMMLFGGPLRVVLATRHVPLSAVPRRLTRRTVLEAVCLTAEALPWLGCRRARVAVCGLNPHAGEGGLLGREEIRTIGPAIASARRLGLRVHGPLPADTVFHAAAHGAYDAVVAMYHDQGLAPLKLIAFESGVNVTLGLPIVRTSPDHGTAFDLAGRNVADPSSMAEALRQAVFLAARSNPWRR